MPKKKITISIDEGLFEKAMQAVDRGRAESMSAFVSAAMRQRVEDAAALDDLRLAIEDYEAEFGVITEERMAERIRLDQKEAAANRHRYGTRRTESA